MAKVGPLPGPNQEVKFSDLRTEYDGDSSVSMSEYYRGGPQGYVRAANSKSGYLNGVTSTQILLSVNSGGNNQTSFRHFYIGAGNDNPLTEEEDIVAMILLNNAGLIPPFANIVAEGYESSRTGGTNNYYTGYSSGRENGLFNAPRYDWSRYGGGISFSASGLGMIGSWLNTGGSYPQKTVSYVNLTINGTSSNPINETVPNHSYSSNGIIKTSNFASQDNDGYSDEMINSFQPEFAARYSDYY